MALLLMEQSYTQSLNSPLLVVLSATSWKAFAPFSHQSGVTETLKAHLPEVPQSRIITHTWIFHDNSYKQRDSAGDRNQASRLLS